MAAPGVFPPDFLWGTATAAHQVEGGNRWNDWWEYEESGRLPHRSGEACEHYERYASDFDLAAAMGHRCHRFSIEWSRVEPEENRWNPEALAHYGRVIRALRERGIEPVVTLFHFTLPAWFARRGGWEHPAAVERFVRFVEFVLDHLDGEVRYWLTVNEPTVYVQQAYLNAEWPPLRRRAWIAAGRVLGRLARAHRAAYERIRARRPQAQVSFAHSALWMEPCNPDRWLDRFAARLRDCAWNRYFFWRVGRRHLDFVGLNYYTRCCVRFAGRGPAKLLGQACRRPHHAHAGARSDVGWESYPRGLGLVLRKFARLGLPIFVTENGIATRDDEARCRFIEEHVAALAGAIAEGLPVLGYLHWSLIDNYEWDRGTQARFGLIGVDFADQSRVPHRSARIYAEICHTNGTRHESECDQKDRWTTARQSVGN